MQTLYITTFPYSLDVTARLHTPRSCLQILYVTTTSPYVLMLVLLIRGATLPGSLEGIKYYLVPDVQKLKNTRVRHLQTNRCGGPHTTMRTLFLGRHGIWRPSQLQRPTEFLRSQCSGGGWEHKPRSIA